MKYLFTIIFTMLLVVGCKNQETLGSHQYNNLKRVLKRSEHVTILNLSGQNLDSIPVTIDKLINLKVLVLNNNNISQLPSTIGNLQKLEVIYLMFNPINKLPKEMENLKSLRILNLLETNIQKDDIIYLKEKLPECLIAGNW